MELAIRKYRLLSALCAKGLTMADLDRLHGLKCSNWTRGSYLPGSEKMRTLCLALDCSADWLLGLSDEPRTHGARTDGLPPIIDHLKLLKLDAGDMKLSGKHYYMLGNARQGHVPTVRTLAMVANDYGCTVDYLLGLGE